MSQINFDFIVEEDYRNGINKIDVYDIVNPTPGFKGVCYGELPKYKGFFQRGVYILHSTGHKDFLCPNQGNTFPYLLDTRTNKVVKAGLWGNGSEYRGWPIRFGKRSTLLNCHTLVASAFLINDMPDKKIFVDHINRERVDFRIENLQWATPSDNSKNRTTGKIREQEEEIIRRGMSAGGMVEDSFFKLWD